MYTENPIIPKIIMLDGSLANNTPTRSDIFTSRAIIHPNVPARSTLTISSTGSLSRLMINAAESAPIYPARMKM